jgi:hypothetical protein
LKSSMKALLVGFASLYPPYLLGSRLRGNDRIWGVQRNEAPLRFLLSPKNGGLGVEQDTGIAAPSPPEAWRNGSQ